MSEMNISMLFMIRPIKSVCPGINHLAHRILILCHCPNHVTPHGVPSVSMVSVSNMFRGKVYGTEENPRVCAFLMESK